MLGLGSCIFAGYSVYSGNDKFYYKLLLPITHQLISAENAHKLAVLMGKYDMFPKFPNNRYSDMVMLPIDQLLH